MGPPREKKVFLVWFPVWTYMGNVQMGGIEKKRPFRDTCGQNGPYMPVLVHLPIQMGFVLGGPIGRKIIPGSPHNSSLHRTSPRFARKGAFLGGARDTRPPKFARWRDFSRRARIGSKFVVVSPPFTQLVRSPKGEVAKMRGHQNDPSPVPVTAPIAWLELMSSRA